MTIPVVGTARNKAVRCLSINLCQSTREIGIAWAIRMLVSWVVADE